MLNNKFSLFCLLVVRSCELWELETLDIKDEKIANLDQLIYKHSLNIVERDEDGPVKNTIRSVLR